MKRLTGAIGAAVLLLMFIAVAAFPAHAGAASFKERFSHPLEIDNPYFPLVPGTTFIYRGIEGHKSTYERFMVTNRTRVILGVEARVIHDTNWTNGKLVEDTFDWYAQDDAGNVWYLGEYTSQYKNGKVIGHEGSWQAGVSGASAGIIMEAHPLVGDTYRQEWLPGVAQDMATVLSLNASVCVRFGCYTHVLKTKEFSRLEPDVIEQKFYARRIGEIKSIVVQGDTEESELVAIVRK